MNLKPNEVLAIQAALGPECRLAGADLARLVGEALWQFGVTKGKLARREKLPSRKALVKEWADYRKAAEKLAAMEHLDHLERVLIPGAKGSLSADAKVVAARILKVADTIAAGPTVADMMEARIGKSDHAGLNLVFDLAFVYWLATNSLPVFKTKRAVDGKFSPFADFVNVALALKKLKPLTGDQIEQKWLQVKAPLIEELRGLNLYLEQNAKTRNKSKYQPLADLSHGAATNNEVATDEAPRRPRRHD